MIRTLAAALTTTTCLVAIATPAAAQTRDFNIPAGSLRAALDIFARQSGRQVIYRGDEVRSAKSPGVRGAHTADDALEVLLAGTGFVAKKDASGAFAVVKVGNASAAAETAASSEEGAAGNASAQDKSADIVVTGSRIRGTPIASSTITLNQGDFRKSGQHTLADVVSAIPQNFGGGQNPGVGQNVPEGNGLNLGSASTINLRGLGNDATLTLLNGHRLAYSVANQATDISTIPLLSVDRIEIVADGASALYGSDAVAGVANIILRRDYSGILTSARLGAATDGGDFQQQYSVLAGSRWNSGGFMVAYEFERDTAINSADRDYAKSSSPGLTLYPALRHHDVILSAHQSLGANLEFKIDGLYNTRKSSTSYAFTATGNPGIDGDQQNFSTQSFAIAPTITLTLPSNWRASVYGFYGEDRSNYSLYEHDAGVLTSSTRGCYCNSAYTVEANADGPLFQLPGGTAKVALGGGYHSNRLHSVRTVGALVDLDVSQDNVYGFGEIDLPVVGPSQSLPLVYRLTLTGALRYERYPGIDSVATPKIGLIWELAPGFELKGSWGKSFKAPTLYQRYTTAIAALFPAAALGGTGYPAGSSAFYLLGGNPNLKPERATNWSITADVQPPAIPGLKFSLSYFNVNYRDRVVSPITYRAGALTNPIYADLIAFNPSASTIAQAIQGLTFLNATGAAYDPSKVVAIANSLNLNVASQQINGVDFAGSYKPATGPLRDVELQASVAYLHSTQRLSADQPSTELAGQLFNPPHWRARGGAVWTHRDLTLGLFGNYSGGVADARTLQTLYGRAMTTFDLAVTYEPSHASGILEQTELSLTVQNIFNRAPPLIVTSAVYDSPYDSTNYSPVGRFISATIRKKW